MINSQLEFYRGDSPTYVLEVKRKNNSQPFDLSGWSITMTGKLQKTDADPGVFQIGTSSSDIVIRVPATDGIADITIPAAATNSLTQATQLYFDVQLSNGLLRHTVISGVINVVLDVSRN